MSEIRTRSSALCALTYLFAIGATACAVDAAPAEGPAAAAATAPQMARLPRAPLPPDAARAAAAATGTLSCFLEYERFSPFATLPVTSFSQPMSTVGAQGVTASDATLLLYAVVNPNPAANLSFEVGVDRVSTGENLSYTVLPSPTTGGPWLFETGTKIAPLTINGVAYDYLRAYCSLRP